jgi:hypothetical protein
MDTNSPGDSPIQWLANEVNEYGLINPQLKPAFNKLIEHAIKMEQIKTRIDYLKGFKNSQSTNLNSFEL